MSFNEDNNMPSITRTFTRLLIKDVMNPDPVIIYDDEDLSRAQELFVEKKVFYLLVVNRSRKLLGVLTQKYLYKIRSPRRIIDENMNFSKTILRDGDSFYERETLDGYILSNIMFKKPFTMESSQTVAEAILHVSQKNLGCIPIVKKNGELTGVLTTKDIMDYTAGVIVNSDIFAGE